MSETNSIVVTGIGLCTSMGPNPVEAMNAGESAVMDQVELQGLPHSTAAVIGRVDLRPWLKRRKDQKLMARPARLALSAAGVALSHWSGETDGLGLYVGVGREPGDDGESIPALVAAQVDGTLDEAAVAGPCRDLYPPLLPLKTLPNMALAHISIHLDIRGENGVWCGGSAAGLAALRAGIWSVREGRSPAALVVAADTWVCAGSVRDLIRVSGGEAIEPPGEAGVALLIESAESARARGAKVLAEVGTDRPPGMEASFPEHHSALGDCKAADGLLAVALHICERRSSVWVEGKDLGQPAVGALVGVEPGFACYAPGLGGQAIG
jgi:3-oxoacyl-[acyl-carrier-protein] synthase II